MKNTAILKYVGIVILAAVLSNFFHELSHWLATECLGYKAGFTMNTSNVKDVSIVLTKTERIITSGAGPIFTIIQAIVFYFILQKRENIFLYPFLFYPFAMRFAATIANIFQANDEGRISLDLGLNLYAISTLVVTLLLILVVKISKKYQYSFLFNFLTLLLCFLVVILISSLDAKFNLKII